MRNFLHFTFLSLLLSLSSQAQDYHPMVVEGTLRSCLQTIVWLDPDDPNESSVEYVPAYYKIEGDTTIDGQNYKKAWEAKFPNSEDFIYYGGLREADKKVYIKPRTSWAEEEKIFDFNLDVGDTLFAGVVNLDIEIAVLATTIDSIQLFDDSFRKRWTFTAHEYSVAGNTFVDSLQVFSWIEGIGKTYCLQWDDIICNYSNYPGYHQELLCFYEPSGLQLYGNPEYENCDYNTLLSSRERMDNSLALSLDIFPNPVEEAFAVNVLNEKGLWPLELQIVNIWGETLQTKEVIHQGTIEMSIPNLVPGMYLVLLKYNGTIAAVEQFIKR